MNLRNAVNNLLLLEDWGAKACQIAEITQHDWCGNPAL